MGYLVYLDIDELANNTRSIVELNESNNIGYELLIPIGGFLMIVQLNTFPVSESL
jgi:hypothetical protein